MLCRSKNSPHSASLFPMPFALNCMMVKEFQSTACVGINGESSYGVGRVGLLKLRASSWGFDPHCG